MQAIPARSTIVTGSGAAEPLGLLQALYARAGELQDILIVGGVLLGGYAFLSGDSPFRLATWFPPGTTIGDSPPVLDYLPITWRQVPSHLRRLRPDACLIQISPADADGFHSPGISASHVRAMVESSALVIAEVNDMMPYTFGTVRIHESELDLIVRTHRQLPVFPSRDPQPADEMIARQVAELVPDGVALQLGVGAIPATTGRELAALGRQDLLVLGQLGDWAPELIKAGTGSLAPPQAIVGEIGGSHSLYCWADRNPAVRMADAETTHGLPLICPQRPRVSVNSALEVDLLGQVNSETLGNAQVGPVGGLLDFAIAAGTRDQDRSIMALRSVTGSGRSRIVPRIEGPVAVPRSLVQIVATEHGTADLRGLSTRERARAILSLADPQHRAELSAAIESME
jgi:4-hydroxybutyrate CoA-transferase